MNSFLSLFSLPSAFYARSSFPRASEILCLAEERRPISRGAPSCRAVAVAVQCEISRVIESRTHARTYARTRARTYVWRDITGRKYLPILSRPPTPARNAPTASLRYVALRKRAVSLSSPSPPRFLSLPFPSLSFLFARKRRRVSRTVRCAAPAPIGDRSRSAPDAAKPAAY